jgi:uncharacterized protein YrrD
MLQLSGSILQHPVLSLRTGSPVAQVIEPIINPNNLKIEGFYCQTENKKTLVLLYQDIREAIPEGLIVNDYDVLAEPSELIRLKETIDIAFDIMGKHVVTTDRQKIGKVSDYAVDTTTMYIQKIYVTQSLFKNLASGNLGIDRNQIVEITNNQIIVNDLHQRVRAHAGAVA